MKSQKEKSIILSEYFKQYAHIMSSTHAYGKVSPAKRAEQAMTSRQRALQHHSRLPPTPTSGEQLFFCGIPTDEYLFHSYTQAP